MMETRTVRSTASASVGYDADTRQMEVTFTSWRSYPHQDVPPDVVENLINNGSPGRYYTTAIKGLYG